MCPYKSLKLIDGLFKRKLEDELHSKGMERYSTIAKARKPQGQSLPSFLAPLSILLPSGPDGLRVPDQSLT